jgi:hypothetical protein
VPVRRLVVITLGIAFAATPAAAEPPAPHLAITKLRPLKALAPPRPKPDPVQGVVARAVAAGDRIARTPYVWGGGHGSFEDSGYDCSGSVSYVLHGAGLLSSPLDSTALMSYGLSGPGRHITIYANASHTFMFVDGRRFDTGYGGEGNRWASGSRPTVGYVVRHPPGL